MSKKFDSYTQVRISPGLVKQVDAMRTVCGYRVSRNAFVEVLLLRGIGVTKSIGTKDSNPQPDSTFKK